MRDLIARIVWNPWVYRLTCAAVTLAGMVGVGIGLRALKATQDVGLVTMVCVPTFLVMLAIALWMDRRGIGPE